MHRSCLHDYESMRVNTMSLDLGQGESIKASNRPPRIGIFPPWLYFSELSTGFSSLISIEYFHLKPPSHLDGKHQGAFIAHKTTHDEHPCLHKFFTMWCGPDMVCHMMMTSIHEFLGDDQDP